MQPLVLACRELLKRKTCLPMVVEESDVSLLVNQAGQTYSWGTPSRGTMAGFPDNRSGHARGSPATPTLIPRLAQKKVRQVCLDEEHSCAFAITECELLAWGTQQNHTMGLGRDVIACYEPEVTLRLRGEKHHEKLVLVSVGLRHGGVLTSHGRLFTWGCKWWGSGHHVDPLASTVLDQFNMPRPTMPPALLDEHIVYFRAHSDATLAVTAHGRVLQPGASESTYGRWHECKISMRLLEQLGFSRSEAQTVMFQLDRALDNVRQTLQRLLGTSVGNVVVNYWFCD